MSNSEVILFDGKFIHADEPIVTGRSRGLMYGDGIFETFRTYRGETFYLNKHLERLQSGIRLLGMDTPDVLNPGKFRQQVYRVLERRQLLNNDSIVRLQLWREGNRGYLPGSASQTHFMITASPCPKEFENPRLATVDCKRIPDESLPSKQKFSNGINYILAARQAHEQGADDALMETIDGFLSETTIANIFWAQDGQVFTPAESCDLIPGITREVLINIINQNPQWKLIEGRFVRDALRDAEVVWICNSVRELLPVRSVDKFEYKMDHPLLLRLQGIFNRFKEAHLESLKDV